MKALKSSTAFRRDTIHNASDIATTIQDHSILTDLGRMTSAVSASPRPTLPSAALTI